jgi:60 kDa SS-A/Ro ribonucleoprotein
MVNDAMGLHARMTADDPEFVSKAIVYARTSGFMRSQPIMGLAHLAGAPKPHFERAFNAVIRTPKDLSDFTIIIKSMRKGEGGRRIKRVAGAWLKGHLSEYYAIKYGAQKDGEGYSLGDLLRLYHPDLGEHNVARYLRGREYDKAWTPQINWFEQLKGAKGDDEKMFCIVNGKLPHEVATTFAGKSLDVWDAIAPQMPVFALLKNLATLERHAVITSQSRQARKMVEGKLCDPDTIRRSKILPFRFMDAEKAVATPWLKDALRIALEYSFANLPDIEGRTAVFLDKSGSMEAYIQTAAIFGVSLMKKTGGDGRFLLFDRNVTEFPVSVIDSVLSQASRIKHGGATDVSAPMHVLLNSRDRFDNIILITDEQQNNGDPFADVLAKYHTTVNADTKCFVIDLSPYRNAITPDDANTFYIYGWSPEVLSFISLASKGWGNIANYVRASSIPL